MTTILITSNADSGAGTLRQALTNASEGDTIALDPTLFPSGATIAISSLLPVASVSIQGTQTARITIDGQGSVGFFRFTSAASSLNFEHVDFVNGYRTTNAESPFYIYAANQSFAFTNCRFFGNTGFYSGFLRGISGATGATLSFHNCLAWNNTHTSASYSASVFTYQSNASPTIELIGCTFDTSGEIPFTNAGDYVKTDSLFNGVNSWNVDFDAAGFVDRSANDYRLTPGSSYLTGGTLTGDDFAGHERSGSIGAFDGSYVVANASGYTIAASMTCDYLILQTGGALNITGSDAILTVAKSAEIGAGSVNGPSGSWGFIFVPSGTQTSAATLSRSNIVAGSAGLVAISAVTTGVSWSATDSTLQVVIQTQTTGVFETIAQTAGTSYSTALAAGSTVRLFDGVTFLSTTVQDGGAPLAFHPYLYYAQTISVDSSPQYLIITEFLLMSQYYNSGETPVLFARVVNSATGAVVDPSTVSAISYTCYKRTFAWSQETREPVEGHEDVTIPTNAILSAVVPPSSDSRWTVDDVGYNFTFEPDTRTYPLFPTPGSYIILVTVRFSDANPAPIQYEITVN